MRKRCNFLKGIQGYYLKLWRVRAKKALKGFDGLSFVGVVDPASFWLWTLSTHKFQEFGKIFFRAKKRIYYLTRLGCIILNLF